MQSHNELLIFPLMCFSFGNSTSVMCGHATLFSIMWGLSLPPGEGALACQSCYEGYKFMSGICESECLIGFYAASQVRDSLCVTCFTKCVCLLFTVWQGCSVSHEAVAVLTNSSVAAGPRLQKWWASLQGMWSVLPGLPRTKHAQLHSVPRTPDPVWWRPLPVLLWKWDTPR